ncbi:glycine betaine ABC transporter substrate-binding protein [Nocardioides nanhaiensis]|uniref:Glycine betaine ABC transporter substrate-binding protein n=1 Tax=Nocardioides nanhaiensis TaxID=1476871 RepID=A0ABP8X1U8_9ACTN
MLPSTHTRAPRRWRRAAAAIAAGTSLALAGCGLATSNGFTPTEQLAGDVADVDLQGLSTSVGSKNFTEQLILGKIAVLLLKAAGAEVTDLTNIPGSDASRQAQEQGDIDLGWEYTGTAWTSYFAQTEIIEDEQEQYEAVRDLDAEENDLRWLPPAPMNNSYGFATTREVAERLGIERLSQLADIPPQERTFCVESEFANREDGFEPMLETYDVPLGEGVDPGNVRTLQTGAIYAATANGDCNFGEVFTTDGRLLALDLVLLEDDAPFFPKYNVSLVVRGEVLDAYPQVEDLFAGVTEQLDDETLIELNARVDVDGERPVDVALDFLRDGGYLE